MIEDFEIIKIKPSTKKKELKDWLGESILDPVRKTLCSEIWDSSDKIIKKVKDEILNRFNSWLKNQNIDKEIEEAYVVGSITTYQYADNSDIDVNIQIDIDKEEIYKLIKLLPNNNMLFTTNHPINYYLARSEDTLKTKETIYDLIKDKWVKKPNKDKVKIPYLYAIEIAKFFITGAKSRMSEYELDNMEIETYKGILKEDETDQEIIDAIESKKLELMADLDAIYTAYILCKSFRREAFKEDYKPDFLIKIESNKPDYSMNNIVYKIIERSGLLDEMEKYKKIREKYKGEVR